MASDWLAGQLPANQKPIKKVTTKNDFNMAILDDAKSCGLCIVVELTNNQLSEDRTL